MSWSPSVPCARPQGRVIDRHRFPRGELMPDSRLLAFWLLTAACAQPRTITPSHEISGAQPITTPSDSGTRGHIRSLSIYEPGRLTYEYQADAVVQSIAGDSIPRSDSTRIQAKVVAIFTGDTGIVRAAEILIDSALVTTITANSTTQTATLRPQRYSAAIDSRTGRIVSDSRDHVETCSVETVTPLLAGDEVLPVVPSLALTKQAWADTSQYRICRGGVLLSVRRTTRSRVEDLSRQFPSTAAQHVYIVRTSEIVLEGQGLQWQQAVQASGTGTSSDTLVLNLDRTRLESLSGHSRIELGFQSTTRTQRFLQVSNTRIDDRAGSR